MLLRVIDDLCAVNRTLLDLAHDLITELDHLQTVSGADTCKTDIETYRAREEAARALFEAVEHDAGEG